MRLLLLVVLGLLLINGLESKRSGRDSDFDDNEFAEFEDFDEDEGNASLLTSLKGVFFAHPIEQVFCSLKTQGFRVRIPL